PRLLFHHSLDQKLKKSTSSNKFPSISTKKLKNTQLEAEMVLSELIKTLNQVEIRVLVLYPQNIKTMFIYQMNLFLLLKQI
ncbi:hypothetical protein COF80_22700, partial [Bacillus toyonensis]